MQYNICSREWADGGRPVSHTAITQGQYFISDDPNAVITTVLGSCVAACIRDPRRGIGGMNHFVLPRSPTPLSDSRQSSRYGDDLMPRLVDALLANGAALHRLEATVFGGANLSGCYYNIGERNLDFALDFLAARGIPVIDPPRLYVVGCRLEYWPVSGKLIHTALGNGKSGHKAS